MLVLLRRMLVGVLLVVLPLCLWFVGTRFCGEHTNRDVFATLAVGVFVLCFAIVVYDSRGITARKLFVVGYVAFVAVVWFVAPGRPKEDRAVVHVENGTADALTVALDDRDWLTVPPGGSVPAHLSRGAHRLTVTAVDGVTRDERTVTVGSDHVYVLNLLGARTYHRGTAVYSVVQGDGLPSDTTDVRDVWFAANVDFLFADPPPSVVVGPYSLRTTRTFLKRGPGPKAEFLPPNAIWGGPGVPLRPILEPGAAPEPQGK